MDSIAAPRVSVVVIFLNGVKYLGESIDSILAQTYRDFELILVDDGSSDGASDLARGYAEREPERVRYLDHPGHANHGMSASRNAGVAISRGDLIAFNDADDMWLPGKLAEQVALIDAHPDAAMIAGGANYWHSWSGHGQDEIIIPGVGLNRVTHPPEALLGIYPLGPAEAPCPSTLLCRKPAYLSIGGFEESYRGMYEDQAFLSKMYLNHPVLFPDACWLNYRQHEDSCSSDIARQGTMMKIRSRYFLWLAEYFRAQGVTDERIWKALRKAARRHKVRRAVHYLDPRHWPPALRYPLRRIRRALRGKPDAPRTLIRNP
ncbi:MAG: glycosyltransferase family 2 protein [Sphingobium sp.]